jgi:uncharacterized membrane protein
MIRTGLAISAACIAISLGAWTWLQHTLPSNAARVPIHWGLSGAPDHFTTRQQAMTLFLLLPGISALIAVLLAVLPVLDPFGQNLRKGGRAYLSAWIGVEILMAAVAVGVAIMTVRATGGDVSAEQWFVRLILAGIGIIFILIGDALPKTRRNFFIGVRTPWTLTSDLAWEKTHRLAGRLMVLIGLWDVVAAFFVSGVGLVFTIAVPVLAMVFIAVIYSYLVWRGDPARQV